MKLEDAVITGRVCGLNTVEECLLNAELHIEPLMSHTVAKKEMSELYKEYDDYYNGDLSLDWCRIKKEVATSLKEMDEYFKKEAGVAKLKE